MNTSWCSLLSVIRTVSFTQDMGCHQAWWLTWLARTGPWIAAIVSVTYLSRFIDSVIDIRMMHVSPISLSDEVCNIVKEFTKQ